MASDIHGGRREGSGRKAGVPNRRSLHLVEVMTERGIEPALELVEIARKTDDDDLAARCWSTLSGMMYPKMRPVPACAEELVELEGSIAAARFTATAKAVDANPGLADRLERVMRLLSEPTYAVAMPAVRPAPTVIDGTLAEPASSIEKPAPSSAEPSEPPASPLPPAVHGDWTPAAPMYRPLLPSQQDMVQVDYDVSAAWGLD